MIGIINYGMGNLRSVLKAIEFLGGSAGVYTEQSALDGCDKLILPGVGSYWNRLALCLKSVRQKERRKSQRQTRERQ